MAEKKKTTTKKTDAKKQEAPAKQEAAAKQVQQHQSEDRTHREPRIGVFICHCGTNIAGSMDIDAVEEYAKTIPECRLC